MPSIEPRATLDVARSTEMSETMINPIKFTTRARHAIALFALFGPE
jgi:hypothetical protein